MGNFIENLKQNVKTPKSTDFPLFTAVILRNVYNKLFVHALFKTNPCCLGDINQRY